MADRKRTKFEEENRAEMFEELRRDIKEIETIAETATAIPPGWWRLDRDFPPTPSKAPVSLRIDEDVLAFFRGYGRGYQTRMNRVLRTYMQARLAKVITSAKEKTAEGDLL